MFFMGMQLASLGGSPDLLHGLEGKLCESAIIFLSFNRFGLMFESCRNILFS